MTPGSDPIDDLQLVPLGKGSSLSGNSLARLASDFAQLVLGFAGAIITARLLGPANKGSLSTLLLIGMLLSYACSLGLGDAAVIHRADGQHSLRRSVEVSALPLLMTSLLGIGVIWIISIPADWSPIRTSVVVASATLPIAVGVHAMTHFHDGEERFFFTSVVAVIAAFTTVLGYVLFISVWDLEILGGVLAIAAGMCAAFAILATSLVKEGLFRQLRLDRDLLRDSLRIGLVAESAFLLVAFSQRLDALVVYAMKGEAPAGRYSIALTVSQLVWYAPFALAAAGFPRLARLDPIRARTLLTRMARVSLASALGSAALLIPVSYWVIPAFFGEGFRSAVVPATILIIGGIFWSEQWLLTRMWAARGGVRLYLVSFLVSVTVMVCLDVALVPKYGLIGAAVASAVASAVGVAVCLIHYVRRLGVEIIRELVPRRGDLFELWQSLRFLIKGPG